MAVQRMDNVAIVVDDLDAAVAFFAELGLEPSPELRALELASAAFFDPEFNA